MDCNAAFLSGYWFRACCVVTGPLWTDSQPRGRDRIHLLGIASRKFDDVDFLRRVRGLAHHILVSPWSGQRLRIPRPQQAGALNTIPISS